MQNKQKKIKKEERSNHYTHKYLWIRIRRFSDIVIYETIHIHRSTTQEDVKWNDATWNEEVQYKLYEIRYFFFRFSFAQFEQRYFEKTKRIEETPIWIGIKGEDLAPNRRIIYIDEQINPNTRHSVFNHSMEREERDETEPYVHWIRYQCQYQYYSVIYKFNLVLFNWCVRVL